MRLRVLIPHGFDVIDVHGPLGNTPPFLAAWLWCSPESVTHTTSSQVLSVSLFFEAGDRKGGSKRVAECVGGVVQILEL